MRIAAVLLLLSVAWGCQRAPVPPAAPVSEGSAATSAPDPVAPATPAVTAPQAAQPAQPGPAASPTPTPPPATGAQPDAIVLPAAALPPELLAGLHPSGPTGGACIVDDQCQPPLRCRQGDCNWPPAMTGERTDDTVVFTVLAPAGPATFLLESATTPNQRGRGMMFRRNVAPGFGMVFVFEESRPQSFWMRNTLVPLDMIFIREDFTIDSIVHSAEPLTEIPRSSDGPAKYVVELLGGTAAHHQLGPGMTVVFDNLPTVP